MGQAGIAGAAVGIEDSQLRPAARRPEPVSGDDDLGALADDVPSQPDPRPPRELEPQPDRLAERAADGRRQTRRLQHDQQATRPTSQRGQPMQPVRETGWTTASGRPAGRRTGSARRLGAKPDGQVHQQEVHRPTLEQRPGHRQPFVDRGRREHHEPFEPDAARHRFDRVEAASQVEVGHDRPAGLGLGREPEGECGLAARQVASERNAGQPRDAAGAEDRVQCGEPGRDDPAVVVAGRAVRRPIVERERFRGERLGGRRRFVVRERLCGEGADDARSCRSPAGLEGRQSSGDVGRGEGHVVNNRTSVLVVNGAAAGPRPPLSRRSPRRTGWTGRAPVVTSEATWPPGSRTNTRAGPSC